MRPIEAFETALGVQAQMHLLPMQSGDVPATYVDISALEDAVGFRPSTTIEAGVRRFVDWYKDYFRVERSKNLE